MTWIMDEIKNITTPVTLEGKGEIYSIDYPTSAHVGETVIVKIKVRNIGANIDTFQLSLQNFALGEVYWFGGPFDLSPNEISGEKIYSFIMPNQNVDMEIKVYHLED